MLIMRTKDACLFVITATYLSEGMIENPVPPRAEACDLVIVGYRHRHSHYER